MCRGRATAWSGYSVSRFADHSPEGPSLFHATMFVHKIGVPHLRTNQSPIAVVSCRGKVLLNRRLIRPDEKNVSGKCESGGAEMKRIVLVLGLLFVAGVCSPAQESTI